MGCGVTAASAGYDKHFMKVAESGWLEVGPVVTTASGSTEDCYEQILERVLKLGFYRSRLCWSFFGITKVIRWRSEAGD